MWEAIDKLADVGEGGGRGRIQLVCTYRDPRSLAILYVCAGASLRRYKTCDLQDFT